MAKRASRNKNTVLRWKKIQKQFKEKMEERTASGAAPKFSSVIDILSEDWCLGSDTIENILRKKL
jgi:hypothetical protein